MKLQEIADGAFVINLAHRTDRMENARKELARIGYEPYERFNAYGVNNPPPERYTKNIPDFKMSGWWGNKFSHYGAIEEAKRRGWKSVAVFEDDVCFHPLFNNMMPGVLSQLSALQWEWFSMGGNHRYFGGISEKVSPIDGREYILPADGIQQVGLKNNATGEVIMLNGVGKILLMLAAHAYVVRESVYDFILEHAIASPLSIDGFFGCEVNMRYNCFCSIPCMARQIPGENDIGGGHADYTWFIGD